jgi:hypothetical protein
MCIRELKRVFSILCAVVYFLLFYFPAGFQTDPSRAGYQFLMLLVTEVLQFLCFIAGSTMLN